MKPMQPKGFAAKAFLAWCSSSWISSDKSRRVTSWSPTFTVFGVESSISIRSETVLMRVLIHTQFDHSSAVSGFSRHSAGG